MHFAANVYGHVSVNTRATFMASNFERHKSARWVKADVPLYGDEWGANLDYPDGEQAPYSGLIHPANAVDTAPKDTYEAPHESSGSQKHDSHVTTHATQVESSPPSHESAQVVSAPGVVAHTAETSLKSTLSTSQSHDSISPPVHESHERVQVPAAQLQTAPNPSSQELPETRPKLKNKLSISTSGLKDDSDFFPPTPTFSLSHYAPQTPDTPSERSFASDADLIQREPENLNLVSYNESLNKISEESPSPAAPPEALVLSIDKMKMLDSENDSDDWGYNSEHSSNNEDFEDTQNDIEHPPEDANEERHRIKTDALDSLINDLQKMDRELVALQRLVAAKPVPEHKSPAKVHHSDEELPSLGSIHDLSLPDFDHLFSEPEPVLMEHHKNYVEQLRERSNSVRKPPQAAEQNEKPEVQKVAEPRKETLDVRSILSSGSISTVRSVERPTQPEKEDLTRTPSLATTFNMGAWQPDTDAYRDKFVADNDNESKINFTEPNNYSKFTGLRDLGYAQSFANSSCLSVPDTVALPAIDENSESFEHNDTVTIASGNSTTRQSSTSFPSVLKEQPYSEKFDEKLSAGTSKDTFVDAESNVVKTRSASGELRELTTLSTKRPRYNWKQIMALSQPIDRIQQLKLASLEEKNYDTGLSNWLHENLKRSQVALNIHIGKIATEAYQNAQHNDLRRHTSIRSKVSAVKDKMDSGNFGLQASNLGRRFLNRGKKLMKSGSD